MRVVVVKDLMEFLPYPDFDSTEVYSLGSWFRVPEAAHTDCGLEANLCSW